MKTAAPGKRCGQITTKNGIGCVLPQGHPLPHYLPAEPVTFGTKTTLSVLFVAGCFFTLGLILYFYG